MTKEEIMQLEGRELDKAVAELVFKRELKEYPRGTCYYDGTGWKMVTFYSQSVSAAMGIILNITAKAERDECGPIVSMEHDGEWHVTIGTARAVHENVCIAICHASLLAIKGE